MDELAFTRDEIVAFARQQLGRELSPNQLDALHRSTEGWAMGVRLSIEALRHRPEDDTTVGVGFLDQAAQEYLVAEVVERTPDQFRQYLLAVSLFDHFNAELCEAVAFAAYGHPSRSGAEFIAWMRRNGLFMVALDPDEEWFRFHHLFARQLSVWHRMSHPDLDLPETEMRRAAAQVMRSHGRFEEAMEQAYLAGDDSTIVSIADERGHKLIEQERWHELARLLDRVPEEVLNTSAELLLLRAWWLGHTQARFLEMSDVLARADARLDDLDDVDGDEQARAHLRGQIAALRAAYVKASSGDIARAVEEADRARELLATTPSRELGFAYLIAIVARVNSGRFAEANALAHSVVGDARFSGSPNDPMLWAMPYLGWEEGDLTLTEVYARQLSDVGQRFGLRDAIPGSVFFLGRAAYERNELAEAESHLRQVVAMRFGVRPLFLTHAWIALTLTELAQGRRDEADATAASMMQFVLALRSEYLQPIVEAFVAELDLHQGRHAAAWRWAQRVDADALRTGWPMFFDPGPALVQVLLSSESEDDVVRGRELLDRRLGSAEHREQHPLVLRLLGLRAVDRATRGDETGALEDLEVAVTMSHRSGMIRRLADLGPSLAPLLHRLEVSGEVLTHVGAILGALEPDGSQVPSDAAVQVVPPVAGRPALTDRERDVLAMLAERYSNKEIARKLFIAPATVKKHTVTLYDKLNVHGRQEAVAKAQALGYLSAC